MINTARLAPNMPAAHLRFLENALKRFICGVKSTFLNNYLYNPVTFKFGKDWSFTCYFVTKILYPEDENN